MDYIAPTWASTTTAVYFKHLISILFGIVLHSNDLCLYFKLRKERQICFALHHKKIMLFYYRL